MPATAADRALQGFPDAYSINIHLEEEGWALFDSSADDALRIERDDDTAILADDEAAWTLVIERAVAGSSLHLAALALLKTEGSEELARILDFATAHQRLALAALGVGLAELGD